MASAIREQLRVLTAFSQGKSQRQAKHIETDTIDDAVRQSLDILQNNPNAKSLEKTSDTHNIRSIMGAVLTIDDILAVYIPFCTWHASLGGWILHFPVSAVGMRRDHKVYASFVLYACKKYNIPVAKIFLQFVDGFFWESIKVDVFYENISWKESDITLKIEKYLEGITPQIVGFLTHIKKETILDINSWEKCTRRYCDACSIDNKEDIDSITTLRKSKVLIEDLLSQGITKISQIPQDIDVTETVQRQIDAVLNNELFFSSDDVKDFIKKLSYPRYYLDFEAFTSAVPFFPYSQPWELIPFLFSLQWQEGPNTPIHTQLWAMPPSIDKRILMWQELYAALKKAGSIIVYDSCFEGDAIKQLSELSGELHKASSVLMRIVDLQEIFLNLHIYHPLQKGKISLKTLTSVFLEDDYSSCKVKEGMAANYFYIKMIDDTNKTFKWTHTHPYIKILYEKVLKCSLKDEISIKDIALYCKYDTQVMIRLVALLEKELMK